MKQKRIKELNEPFYISEKICKVCGMDDIHRELIETWRFFLHSTFKTICWLINQNYRVHGLESPLNEMNLSTHFKNHANKAGFLEYLKEYKSKEYESLMNPKTQEWFRKEIEKKKREKIKAVA